MKGFIYIYQKNEIKHQLDNFIEVINTLKDTEHDFIVKDNEKIRSVLYSNEVKSHVNKYLNLNHISIIGQFVDKEQNIINQLATLKENELIKYVSNLRGAFALAIANYNENSMKFFTHIFRIDNIFYRETTDEIIVGTDPLVVSALSNRNLKPEIEINNSVSFLMNGYFADENTLFKGVELVPPNSVMSVDSNGISIKSIDNSLETMFEEKPNKEINTKIKDDYIEAFKAVPKKASINIGITGGKDSRLALLGLIEAGYNVKTNTRGFLDNPDVQVAKELTKKLNLEHKIIEPKILDSMGMNVNIEKRALQSMVATSGQVYGYENIKLQPNYKGNIGVTGVAALTMKGGYSNLNNLSPQDPFKEMIKRFLPLEELLHEGKSEQYRQTLKSLVTTDFQNAQYKHALFYRNGRWTSGTRLAKSYSSDVYSPYYDNIFTKDIMKIQKKYLDNGFIQYTLMNKLNNKISLLPLVGSRWGFEKDQPVKPENYTGWLNRKPLYPKSRLANYNWRNLTLPDNSIIREEFKNILLKNPEHIVFEVVDYNKLKELLSDKLTSKHLKFMWALLSLYVYINHLNGVPINSKDLNIRIPETIVNKLRNTPDTIDLTGDLYTTNKELDVINSGNKITITTNSKIDNKKRRYLTTFNGNISAPSKDEKALIDGRNEIFFNMHINSTQKLPLKYCVIYFDDDKKKIETEWFNKTVSKNVKNIVGNSKVPKNAETYKIAIKFPYDFEGEIVVDYFFSIIK